MKSLIANHTPSRVMVIDGDEEITQETFLQRASILAEALPSSRYVVNLCRNRLQFMLAFAAALMTNKITLLPPNRQTSTVQSICDDYPDLLCLADQPLTLGNTPVVNVLSLQKTTDDVSKPQHVPTIDSKQLAAIAFTSGSTGKPTPIKKHWGTLAGTATLLGKRFAKAPDTPYIIATVPSQHMYGLEMTVMMALQAQCCISTSHAFYPQDVINVLTQLPQPRLLVTTPIHLKALLGTKHPPPTATKIVSATAPLGLNLATEVERQWHTEVHEIYGCTEAGSLATRRTNMGETWQLLDGVTMKQMESIVVSGPQLAQDTPIQDHLELLPNHQFKLVGRPTDMINVGGKRSSIAELTLRLLEIEGVKDGLIYIPDTNNPHQRPAAVVVSTLDKRHIQIALAQTVDPVFIPRVIHQVSHIPRNDTGKITQSALKQLLEQLREPS